MAGTNIREDVIDDAAMKLADEIDRELLWGMLCENGWTRVNLSRFRDNFHAVDIRIWIEENVKGKFISSGAKFIFENPKDALMFTLRWYD